MNPKKENKEREQSPRSSPKRKEKLLPFEQFKDIHHGESAIIFATGPTIKNYTPLEGTIKRRLGNSHTLEGVIKRRHGIIKCIWIMEAWILRERVDKLLRAKLMMWLSTSLRESTNWIYGDFSFSEEHIWNNCDTRHL